MRKYNVIFTDEADDDLTSIAQYISLDNPYKALAFISEIQSTTTQTLSFFPQKYAEYKSCRIFPYRSYLVIYDIDESINTVHVLSVTHSAEYTKYSKYFD